MYEYILIQHGLKYIHCGIEILHYFRIFHIYVFNICGYNYLPILIKCNNIVLNYGRFVFYETIYEIRWMCLIDGRPSMWWLQSVSTRQYLYHTMYVDNFNMMTLCMPKRVTCHCIIVWLKQVNEQGYVCIRKYRDSFRFSSNAEYPTKSLI